MAGGIDANMAAVRALSDEFTGVRARLRPAMKKVASRGALNIKNAARASIIAQVDRKYVKQYPNSITYSFTVQNASVVSVEIGPDKDKPQGALGNLLEFGTPSNGGPRPHLIPAWENEADNFEKYMGEIAETVLGATVAGPSRKWWQGLWSGWPEGDTP